MTRTPLEQVADAVLYEGYILYPYRPSSVKNRQRWSFGGVYPRAYSEAQRGADNWQMHTECLAVTRPGTLLTVRVRCLHLLERQACAPRSAAADPAERLFDPVPLLRVGERSFPSWQEATEREARLDGLALTDLHDRPTRLPFVFATGCQTEAIHDAAGQVAGMLVRQHERIEGELEVSARRLEGDLSRVTVTVRNTTVVPKSGAADREFALRHTLVSTHAILHLHGGEFVSLLDPPAPWRAHAEACRNVGAWPVLAGAPGATDAVLCSPIILYDYPQVAPESPQDLFDATEIDEILTLRILTLTDDEKREMCAADERARLMLERAEALAREQMLGLHGTVRGLRPVPREDGRG